jgi:hypothetical protein
LRLFELCKNGLDPSILIKLAKTSFVSLANPPIFIISFTKSSSNQDDSCLSDAPTAPCEGAVGIDGLIGVG